MKDKKPPPKDVLDGQVVCKNHPRYQKKRKPRTLCETCWALWIFKQVFGTPE